MPIAKSHSKTLEKWIAHVGIESAFSGLSGSRDASAGSIRGGERREARQNSFFGFFGAPADLLGRRRKSADWILAEVAEAAEEAAERRGEIR